MTQSANPLHTTSPVIVRSKEGRVLFLYTMTEDEAGNFVSLTPEKLPVADLVFNRIYAQIKARALPQVRLLPQARAHIWDLFHKHIPKADPLRNFIAEINQ